MDLQNLYIIGARAYDEYAETDFAILRLAPALATGWLEYMELVKRLQGVDREFYCIRLWESSGTVYATSPAWGEGVDEEESDFLDGGFETLEPMTERLAFLFLADDGLVRSDLYVKTETPTVTITNDGITLQSHLSWCSVVVETWEITRAELLAIVAQEDSDG